MAAVSLNPHAFSSLIKNLSSATDSFFGGRHPLVSFQHLKFPSSRSRGFSVFATCTNTNTNTNTDTPSLHEPWFSSASPLSSCLNPVFVVCASTLLCASALFVATNQNLHPDERATVQLYQDNAPSIVGITGLNWLYKHDLDAFRGTKSAGSGFFWDSDGHVVTNNHVISSAAQISVTLNDNTTYEAKVVGSNPDMDVAVLRVDAPKEKLRPIRVGVSAHLLVGQKVYVIGNPFGTGIALSTGVISRLHGEIRSPTGHLIPDAIQTDAAINPGNSGGPLFDSSGSLIGIITTICSPSGASCGVGLSISIDTVVGIVNQLLKHGTSDLF